MHVHPPPTRNDRTAHTARHRCAAACSLPPVSGPRPGAERCNVAWKVGPEPRWCLVPSRGCECDRFAPPLTSSGWFSSRPLQRWSLCWCHVGLSNVCVSNAPAPRAAPPAPLGALLDDSKAPWILVCRTWTSVAGRIGGRRRRRRRSSGDPEGCLSWHRGVAKDGWQRIGGKRFTLGWLVGKYRVHLWFTTCQPLWRHNSTGAASTRWPDAV